MRVLIDECLPSQLRGWLSPFHTTSTLRDMGWEGLKNGKLLRMANDHLQPGQKVVMDLGKDADVWESMRLHAIEQETHHTTHKFKTRNLDV